MEREPYTSEHSAKNSYTPSEHHLPDTDDQVRARRIDIAKRLRHETPDNIRAALEASGADSGVLDELMNPMPRDRLRWHQRTLQFMVVAGWSLEVLSAFANFAFSFVDGGIFRYSVSLLVSIAFFHHIRRLNGRAYGPSALWLVAVIIVSFAEIDALSPAERVDASLMIFIWTFVYIATMTIAASLYLKATLYAHVPWFRGIAMPLDINRADTGSATDETTIDR